MTASPIAAVMGGGSSKPTTSPEAHESAMNAHMMQIQASHNAMMGQLQSQPGSSAKQASAQTAFGKYIHTIKK